MKDRRKMCAKNVAQGAKPCPMIQIITKIIYIAAG